MHRFNLLGVDRQWATIDGRKSFEALWNSINWNKVKQIVNRLQARIVKAVNVQSDLLSGAQRCLINA